MHKKGLRRQIGASPLVSSQERRALVVLWVNGLLCSAISLQRILFVRASGELFRTFVFDPMGAKGSVVSWANRPVGVPCQHIHRERTAGRVLPRLAPPRPWYVRVWDSTGSHKHVCGHCRTILQVSLGTKRSSIWLRWQGGCPWPPRHYALNDSKHLTNPKPGHTMGVSGRGGARPGGGARRGAAGPGADSGDPVRPGENRPSCPPGRQRQPSLFFFCGNTH